MQWIILIGDKTLSLDAIRDIKHYDSTSSHDVPTCNRYLVNFGKEYVYYDYMESLIEEYQKSELQVLPFKEPRFIMMIHHSIDLVMKILRQDNFLRGIYVDDDNGRIVPIEEFIKPDDEEKK